MSDGDKDKKQDKLQEILGRLKIIKVHDLTKLTILLAKILS